MAIIFKLLPTLMEMTRADYRRFCYEYEGGAFAGGNVRGKELIQLNTKISVLPIRRANPILPALDSRILAERLLEEYGL